MPFATDSEARQFLADKILQESQLQGASISDVERRLLMFSVDDPASAEGIPNDELYDPNPNWERRMTKLLRDAWQRDRDNPGEHQLYRDAMERLKGGDHYIQGEIIEPTASGVPTRAMFAYWGG